MSGEFAAAFVAANKKQEDYVSLTAPWDYQNWDYLYEIDGSQGSIYVKCWCQENRDKPVFEGTLEEMQEFVTQTYAFRVCNANLCFLIWEGVVINLAL